MIPTPIALRQLPYYLAAIAALTAFLPSDAAGAPPGFSPAASSESFENLNRPDSPNAIDNLPTPFTFPSGLSIVSPAPNAVDSSGVFIVEGGFFGFAPGPGGAGVPDGEAYLGQGAAGINGVPVQLNFPIEVARAGAFVAIHGDNNGAITIDALSSAGAVLDSLVVTGVGPDQWPNNFVTLASPGIVALRFTGDGGGVLRVDLVAWDPVPEPSTLALAALASAAGLRISRRRPGAAVV